MVTISLTQKGPYGEEVSLSSCLDGMEFFELTREIRSFFTASVALSSEIRHEQEEIEKRATEFREQSLSRPVMMTEVPSVREVEA